MQEYRIEAGKLAETWLMFQPLGSAWPDSVGQERLDLATPSRRKLNSPTRWLTSAHPVLSILE